MNHFMSISEHGYTKLCLRGQKEEGFSYCNLISGYFSKSDSVDKLILIRSFNCSYLLTELFSSSTLKPKKIFQKQLN